MFSLIFSFFLLFCFDTLHRQGGLVSVWLMGCHDKLRDKWCTVTKCGNGFDDDRLTKLQTELLPLMDKIKNDFSR